MRVEIAKIRNVGLAGHGSGGKTSLAEALLFNAGASNRLGRVEEGTTVLDYDEDEIKRRITISTALAFLEWKGHKVNLLDTPGFGNFLADTKTCLRVVDTTVIVIPAPSGVQVQTDKVWSYATEYGHARVIYLSKMDRERADFARAVEEYRASLRLAPQSSKTWSNLGMALQALGRVEEAVQVYQQAIQIQPDQPVFYHNLGGLRLEQGDWPGAATAFRKALDLGYHNLETYLSLAEIYLETGKVEAALELCRQALATQPSSAAQFKLGLAYLRLGQTAQARVAYEEGIKQFGAGEGERIGAVDDLKDLIARGIQGAEAQRILDNYWKNRSGE